MLEAEQRHIYRVLNTVLKQHLKGWVICEKETKLSIIPQRDSVSIYSY